ncbi:MAG: LamG domain-containing protein [Candidatus Omnitrophota bacterium]
MAKKWSILFVVIAGGLAIAQPIAAETVGYFKFDNIKGSNFTDDLGKGLLGVLGLPPEGGEPEIVTGPTGAAADKAVKISVDKELIIDDDTFWVLALYAPLTIECWVKSPGFAIPESEAAILSYGGGTGGYRLTIAQAGTLSFDVPGAGRVDTDVAFPFDDAWHHLAVVDDWDGNAVKFYLDGKEVFSQAGALDPQIAGINALYIGKIYQSPNYVTYQGSLDRVRISNAALALDDLDDDAANVKPVGANTVAFYDFNEGKTPYTGKGSFDPTEAITLQAWATGNSAGPEVSTDTPSGAAGDFSLHFTGTQVARVEDANRILDVGGEGNNWTLEAWVKYENTSLGRMIIFYYGPGGISFSLSAGNPRHVFVTTLRIRDIDSGTALVPPGDWHHVAVVHFFGEGMSFYVDGEELAWIDEVRGARIADTPRLNIGSEPNRVLPYDGWIDRLRISNTALDPSEFDSNAKQPVAVLDWSLY